MSLKVQVAITTSDVQAPAGTVFGGYEFSLSLGGAQPTTQVVNALTAEFDAVEPGHYTVAVCAVDANHIVIVGTTQTIEVDLAAPVPAPTPTPETVTIAAPAAISVTIVG